MMNDEPEAQARIAARRSEGYEALLNAGKLEERDGAMRLKPTRPAAEGGQTDIP